MQITSSAQRHSQVLPKSLLSTSVRTLRLLDMRKQANLPRVMYSSLMLVASTLHFVSAANTMVARDAAVLKAVSQTWGLDWNWTDPCSTPWLSCSTTGDVTNLTLSENNLNGSIPESLGNLKNLIQLDLSMNFVTGSVPESLGKLTNLQKLTLRENYLNGSIPESLGNLKNLIELDLSMTFVTGSVPESLGRLSNLQKLYLSGTKLNGSIPLSLGNLKNLHELDMKVNRLTGSIPESLGNLKNLKQLDLSLNLLDGKIPASLGNLINLQRLYLIFNKLNGSIPESLGNLKNLEELELFNNSLTGNIPASLGGLQSLQRLSMGNNNLTGNIPVSLGGLHSLSSLGLYNNHLTGIIPASLGGLQELEFLNLSYNSLTGSIPETLGNLTKLLSLGLSNNELEGRIPESLGNLKKVMFLSLTDNFLTSIVPALGYLLPVNAISGNCLADFTEQRSKADCQTHAARSSSRVRWWIWLTVSMIVAVIILALVATAFFLAKRNSNHDPAMDVGNVKVSTLATYTLAEIRSMTRNWSEGNLLGRGGFGSVYKGVVEGQLVAVKRLKMEGVKDDKKAMKEFLNEVAVLSKVRHKNLVALKGFYCSRGERILVMEFVNNGNLADHLFYHEKKGLPVLEWSIRCRIATTAAEALHYLHSLNDEKIIHRDIKAENILLDDSYNSLVCDFGLAKLTPQLVTGSMPTVATRNIAGTRGYMAPEWLIQGILSDKMDVYSFGIVLLELVTGSTRFKCFSLGEGPDALYSVHEAAWIVCASRQDALSLLMDPNIAETAPPPSVISMLRLALHCINEERRDRPTMEGIVHMLKGMTEVPPLPTQPPSWLQEVESSIDLSNCNTVEDLDVREALLDEHEDRESTLDTVPLLDVESSRALTQHKKRDERMKKSVKSE